MSRKIKSLNSIKDSSSKKKKPKIIVINIYLYTKMFALTNLIFSNITTNKNRTATAPTYTIIKSIAKNSAPKITSKQALLKKTKIKQRIEWTGFFDMITPRAKKIAKKEKKKKSKFSKSIGNILSI